MPEFLHGIEVIEVNKGPKPIRVVRSGVIALPGTAPKGPVNTLTLVKNPTDASQFGENLPGFTIPEALDIIFKQGSATVLVVNVVDTTANTNTVAVTNESVTVSNRAAQLAFAPFGTIVVKSNDGNTTYVAGTDYTIDAFGKITILAAVGTIAESAVLKVSYRKFDPTSVTDAQIIGSISGNTKTGAKLFMNAYSTFGFKPKVLCFHGFSHKTAIIAEMRSMEDRYRAIGLYDAEDGKTISQAISGRGPASTIPGFNTSSGRSYLLYPYLFDPTSNRTPYSAYMAGLISAVDEAEGFHVSPSNHEIKGTLGPVVDISADLSDASTDAQALNEAGITTIFNAFGTGIRSFGNRLASYPSSSEIKTFISIRRIADIMYDSIELGMLPFIDQPIDQRLIDDVLASANAFVRALILRRALYPGSQVTYDPDKNPSNNLAQGKVKFDMTFVGPPPMERATFEAFIDTSLLSQLK